ncbi:MAG: PSD1 domain-containing protein [Planctomycetales bacterium]|nr:PSD1 domain-containing protein [Planctomycetales bacterium]
MPNHNTRSRDSLRRGTLVVAALLISIRLDAADDSPLSKSADQIDFTRGVRPILVQHCQRCHGEKKRQGGLRLTNRREAIEPADSGRVAIRPGKSADSELVRRLTLDDDEQRMPLGGEPLAKREIDLLRRWIDSGAVWPDDAEAGQRHWAYVKPVRPAVPQIRNLKYEIRNPIDAFVLDRLVKENLQPSPVADKSRLIRRVSLDLIGLPPSPDEVAEFEADRRPDAYERVVDRLLASPHYGEKWASQWLDLARYADSNGFQRDGFRDVWAYRDWVVRAFNADMPFDQFSIEQIAGDLIPAPDLPSPSGRGAGGEGASATLDRLIATGFHRCTTVNVEAGTDQEENRVNQVFDRVSTTGLVWLGTTLECAQCHNHKYDPITQREYYQLFAFFNNTEVETKFKTAQATAAIDFVSPTIELPDPALEHRRGELRDELASLAERITARQTEFRRDQAAIEKQLTKQLSSAEQWHVLDIADLDSLGDQATFKILDDGSVLIGGDPPDKDTYTVTVRTKLTNVTGFKLETLTDPSLPGDGPGRGDAERPNFVLNTFRVTAEPSDSADRRSVPATIRLTNAHADFSQPKYDVSGAIDNDPKTAWAINPKFHQSHHSTFDTAEPVGFAGGTTLTFVLEQNYGAARSIGRLRLSARRMDVSSVRNEPDGRGVHPTVPADVAAILATDDAKRTAKQTTKIAEFLQSQDDELRSLRQRQDELNREQKSLANPQSLVMRELSESRETAMFRRGNFLDRGEPVQAGVPAVLHPLPVGPPNRLTFAHWLASPDNPLVARVAVNRWWAEMFGRGLVATLEDFGSQGDRPTHPELLDWLACEFVAPTTSSPLPTGEGPGVRERRAVPEQSAKSPAEANTNRKPSDRSTPPHPSPLPEGEGATRAWSMKHIHRLIVTSATYRQSSRVTPELLRRDDRNELYARGPRLRLSAEVIRDQALSVAGLLSRKLGGPPVRPFQPDGVWNVTGLVDNTYRLSQGEDAHRRGLYVIWRRSAPYPSFVNFDAPTRTACVVRRSRSNTPQQALTLLNDPVYVEATKALTRRILDERPTGDAADRIRHGFRLTVAREPTTNEIRLLSGLVRDETTRLVSDPQAVRDIVGSFALPEGIKPSDFAVWYAMATVLMNLDEAITKG